MKAGGTAGFTLLEIIVALAVFGFLLVGLDQTMRFGLSAWRQDASLSAGKADMDAVDRSLRAIIENFAPGDDAGLPALEGTGTTLVGRTRLRVPGSGLVPVRIEAGLALSGNRLVLRWRPYHHWTPFGAAPPPQEADLADGVARLGIAYWQREGGWTSTWTDPDLPLLIRLRVTFAGQNAPRWPDIVAAPRLSRP
jgi:general secretion pathway protein J